MEGSEQFRSVIAVSKEIDQLLLKCDEASQAMVQACEEVKKEIEEHFERCLVVVAARRVSLLHEVESKLNNHKSNMEVTIANLQKSSVACKELLRAGSAVYECSNSVAENIWKEAKFLPRPEVLIERTTVTLPEEFFLAIEKHGSVMQRLNSAVVITTKNVQMVRTAAGSGKGYANGEGKKALFNFPYGICLNPSDNCLYISDCVNYAIRRLSKEGVVSTLGKAGNITCPTGIAMLHKDNTFFVACHHEVHQVSKVTSSGDVRIFAGGPKKGYKDGIGTKASFENPKSVAIDQVTGTVFVSDNGNNMIRKITPEGVVTTLAGVQDSGLVDGKGTAARFNEPWGICFDEVEQALLVCDHSNSRLRKVSLDGEVTTICSVECPTFVLITSSRRILVSSANCNRITEVIQQGSGTYEVRVIAGSGQRSSVDGKGMESSFNRPIGMAYCEESQVCFVADSFGHQIREVHHHSY